MPCNPFSNLFQGGEKAHPHINSKSKTIPAAPTLYNTDSKTAARLKKEEAASKAYLSQHVKRCPRCQAGVQRYGGCNQIHCRCGELFCYGCVKPWNQHATTCIMHPQFYITLQEKAREEQMIRESLKTPNFEINRFLEEIFRSQRPIPTLAQRPHQVSPQVQLQSPPQDLAPDDPPPEYTPLPAVDVTESSEEIQARKTRQREEELASERYIRENTKTCPSCLWAMEKVEGCNHMTCLCGHSFCWLCLVTWEQSIFQAFHLPTCALHPQNAANPSFQFTGRRLPGFANPSTSTSNSRNSPPCQYEGYAGNHRMRSQIETMEQQFRERRVEILERVQREERMRIERAERIMVLRR
ncbi:hypothetical protein BKA65DRAFT_476774 [Rhexocercosporidium sp. MPI-PUGE-AT-0058]|nr:hypothetical protein BKA65DRAFT_476774 [Rhexocercosporidium sp. MPI-PUGE-AT-0058]